MISLEWFKAKNNLSRSTRRYRFETILGIDHGLHYLWLWHTFLSEQSIDGDVSKFTAKEISKACEWTGDPDIFIKGLYGADFVEMYNKRTLACDWWRENGRNIREIARGRKVEPPQDPRERYKKKRRGRPGKNAGTDIHTDIDQKDVALGTDGVHTVSELLGQFQDQYQKFKVAEERKAADKDQKP